MVIVRVREFVRSIVLWGQQLLYVRAEFNLQMQQNSD